MPIWKPASEKPPDGAIVAVIEMHWKKKGWQSIDMNFGEVEHFQDCWRVSNNDERGGGGEWWAPDGPDSFDYWCFACDLPDLPEWT